MAKLSINKVYDFLGRNENSATIISCLIAIFKGTFRPIFTMTDKTQDPKTKKFAAIREGLTEVAALPLYAATPYLAAKIVKKFYKGDFTKRVETNSKFLGVCVATTLIPAVCNLIQPPIMNALKKHAEKKAAIADLNSPQLQPQTTVGNKDTQKVNPKLASFTANRVNYGMKVGGC